MIVDAALAAFVTSPVMIILGASDRDHAAAIGRAVGARVVGPDAVELFVSEWQWPELVAALREAPRLAATFCRPSDYAAWQLKGPVTAPRAAGAEEVEAALAYSEAIGAALAALGVPPAISAPWRGVRELVVLRMTVREAFVQTPGPAAGGRAEAGA